ncbi:hypothetical protein [Microbaculum marinum]|uniref:Uncharacterized protein n=1 Tax=Microbaculum marinum TaxID=1764581 RepID=A0AAW9RKN4_9HYPH
MTYEEFRESLGFDRPPPALAPLLQALWHLDKGDWHRSHEIAQAIESPDAAWVHAHLHRVEGDVWNADYWYRRAGRQRPEVPLEDERAELVTALLRTS